MKRVIIFITLGISACSTGNPFGTTLEDYQGKDASIIQVKKYLDAKITFYEKDSSKNCLVKKETLIMNNNGLFNHKRSRMNNDSPFGYLGKTVVEYNLRPAQYAELSVKPGRNWINDTIEFKIEANRYYVLNVQSKDDKYSYRIIDVPKGKEKVFSTLGTEYNAKSWDLTVCN